jgi:phosphonate transport system substrate-binding protein
MENQPPPQKSRSDPVRARIAKAAVIAVLMIGVFIALYNVLKPVFLDQSSRFAPRNWINLDAPSGSPAVISSGSPAEEQSLRIAIAPIVSPEKSLEMYESFIQYVARKLGRKPVSLYRPTYSETNDLVRYQRCDLAIVCTYPFIRGEREFGMQALVVPQINGETTYQSVVLVSASIRAATILDLRGKRFASADIISTTGWLFPAMLLMDAHEDPSRFFGKLMITGSHDRSLEAVVNGYVDAAAVHGIVYEQMVSENPSILKKVRVLIKSPPFGIPPVVVHPKMNPALKEEVQSVLLKMNEDEVGKQILSRLHIEKFVVPEKNLFAPLRVAINKLEQWR